MMWKNFNVIYHNNANNGTGISGISGLGPTNDSQTGLRLESNTDCLIQVLTHLSVKEKVKCRSVCGRWREAVDKVLSGQRSLEIIYAPKKAHKYYELSSDLIHDSVTTYLMSRQIKFQLFHQMMALFPSLKTLTVRNLPLDDVMLLVLANTCRQLTRLSFSSCIAKRDYHNNNYINNNSNQSTDSRISTYGWKLLIDSYSGLKGLTIKNCDLNDDDCELILRGFPAIADLDLSDNERLSGSRLHLLGN